MSRKTEPRSNAPHKKGNCSECMGTGHTGMYWDRCNSCDGTGKAKLEQANKPTPEPKEAPLNKKEEV